MCNYLNISLLLLQKCFDSFFVLCNYDKHFCKEKSGVMVYLLLIFFYLTKMHVPALCKQIVSDAATNGLLLHFGASVTNMQFDY